MDPTIHYTISTTFSPSLLLYQLYIKTRADLKWPISMGRREYTTKIIRDKTDAEEEKWNLGASNTKVS